MGDNKLRVKNLPFNVLKLHFIDASQLKRAAFNLMISIRQLLKILLETY